ncbi:MAG: hypothetical protein AAF692_02250 [Pseudomonadota bacterium]
MAKRDEKRFNRLDTNIKWLLLRCERCVIPLQGHTLETFSADLNLIDATSQRLRLLGMDARRFDGALREIYHPEAWEEVIEAGKAIFWDYFKCTPPFLFRVTTEEVPKIEMALKTLKKERSGPAN